LVHKKAAGAKYIREPRLLCDYYIAESLLSGLSITGNFFVKPVLMLVRNISRSQLPDVFTTGELRLNGVFITGESFWTPGSCYTDFNEHTTIFKVILKIDCRLV
jgi:hypothetical protein